MLPDFTKAKALAEGRLLQLVERLIPFFAPLLKDVSICVQHEGKAGRIVREDGSESPIDHYTVEGKFVQTREKMKHSDLESIKEVLISFAKQIGEEQTKQMLVAAEKAAKSVGNVLDAGGELTADKFLDLFRKVEIDFDPHTLQQKQGTAFVMSPEAFASVLPKVKEWEKDPDFKAKYEQIMAVNREKWRDREANRKLVN